MLVLPGTFPLTVLLKWLTHTWHSLDNVVAILLHWTFCCFLLHLGLSLVCTCHTCHHPPSRDSLAFMVCVHLTVLTRWSCQSCSWCLVMSYMCYTRSVILRCLPWFICLISLHLGVYVAYSPTVFWVPPQTWIDSGTFIIYPTLLCKCVEERIFGWREIKWINVM